MEKIIYLSPHLDDAVLSCGAILWEQVRQHKLVEIWTIFAGDPPTAQISPLAQEIHERWQTGVQAPASRRKEDTLACERLGLVPVHLSFPDCIYRTLPGSSQPLIAKNDDLFQPLPANQNALISEIIDRLRNSLPAEATLVIPLGVGNHIDHQIVRQVGETLRTSRFYFADFPYSDTHTDELSTVVPENSSVYHYPINNQSLAAWQYAVEAYATQISTFWPSMSEMYRVIEAYAKSPLGNCLWQSQKSR